MDYRGEVTLIQNPTHSSPSWLEALRGNSEAALLALPLPSSKEEGYRFTSLKGLPLDWQPDTQTSEAVTPPKEWATALGIGITPNESVGPKNLKDSEVILKSLKEALSDDAIRPYLDCPAELGRDLFARIVTARWQNGIVLIIPKGKKAEIPVHAIHSYGGKTTYTRTIVVVEEGAEVEFLEEHTGNSELAFSLIEVVLKENAKARHILYQGWSSEVQAFSRAIYRLEKKATLDQVVVTKGTTRSQLRSEVCCEGEGSEFYSTSAAKLSGKNHFDYWVTVQHQAPHTRTGLDHLTVVSDQSRSVFNGNLIIPRHAIDSEGYQRNKNLALSDKAIIESLPKLEIATDQVKCAHGASTGPVDPEQKYYLQSRGMSEEESETMIVNGFLNTVFEKIKSQEIQSYVSKGWLDETLKKDFHNYDE